MSARSIAFIVGEEMLVLKKKSGQNLASGDGGVVQAFFTRANGLASTPRLASPSSSINTIHLSSTAAGSQEIRAPYRRSRYVFGYLSISPSYDLETVGS